MSGIRRTYRATTSDGQVVEVTNSAGWTVYSFVKGTDGKWHDYLRGSSGNSVRARTLTALGHHNFEVLHMAEIMPEPIEKYFARHPVIQGQRFAIQEVFIDGLGWVKEIPGGHWGCSKPADAPYKVSGSRPSRSFCRQLALFGVRTIAVGNPYLWADFQVSELGFRLPKRAAA
jgi:hypothetical protein